MDFLNGAPVGEALLFSAVAYLVPLLLGWWIFSSRVALGGTGAVSSRHAGVLAVLLGAAGLSLTTGGIWDAMKHIKTGEIPAGADFLWAPHIMIYASFLAIFAVAVAVIGALAVAGWRQGVRDARLWMRQNPALGGLALAALYALLSVPGDAIWHQIFGVDLTAWSLPHVMLGLSGNAVNLCALGVYLRTERRSVNRVAVSAVFLAIVLNLLSMLGVLEWEVPGSALNGLVLHRPIWLYPVVFGGLAYFVVTVGRRLIPRWGATTVALAGYGIRAALTAIMGATGYPMPHFLPVMLLGAILLDVMPWERVRLVAARHLTMALLYTAGYLIVALPFLATRTGLPPISMGDVVAAFAITVVVALAVGPAGEFVAVKLLGNRQTDQAYTG